MAELIFALLSLAALFALAMNRAPLWAWAAAIALFTLSLQMGLGSGHLHAPVFNFWAVLGWLVAGGLFALTFPRLKHDYVGDARLSRAQGRHAHDLRDRA